MLRFAVRRLLNMLFVMFAISVLVFLIFNKIPSGDPALRIAGRTANETLREQVREDFGFNDPIHVQYYELMKKTATGELESYSNRVNVWEEIRRGIPATASLVIGAAVIWVCLGVAFGAISAVYAGRLPDRILTIVSIVGISLPVFWVGALLLYYLTNKVPLFPAGGYVELTKDPWGWFTHLVLPWTALSILFVGFYSRLMRSNMLDTMNEDYVRTARAKGLSERRVLVRHVMRSSLIPIVTLFGLDFGAAFGGGAILTESVFGLQGVGQYAADSIGSLDLPPIMGVTLYGAFFIVLMSAIVDIAYAFLDPRIRLSA
jgi:peptide/nickel transport system permease protein